MPIGNLNLETPANLQKAREVVIQVLTNKGYKVGEDTQNKIIFKHSLGARYYSHNLEVDFLSQVDKTMIHASINHWAGQAYLERVSKELEKGLLSLVPIVYPKLYDLLQGEQVLWRHDIAKGVIHKEVVAEWMITNQRAIIRMPITNDNPTPKIAYSGHLISESIVMNQFRKSQGERIGNFVGAYGGGSFAGVSSGISSSKSTSYGDLVFLVNGKETLRFRGVSDPNGVNRLVKALRKQLKEQQKAKSKAKTS